MFSHRYYIYKFRYYIGIKLEIISSPKLLGVLSLAVRKKGRWLSQNIFLVKKRWFRCLLRSDFQRFDLNWYCVMLVRFWCKPKLIEHAFGLVILDSPPLSMNKNHKAFQRDRDIFFVESPSFPAIRFFDSFEYFSPLSIDTNEKDLTFFYQ